MAPASGPPNRKPSPSSSRKGNTRKTGGFGESCQREPEGQNMAGEHPSQVEGQNRDSDSYNAGAEAASADRSTQATSEADSDKATLENLWEEPGVDSSKVRPTRDEMESRQAENRRDGLSRMTTGPECSVCGNPFTYENIEYGMSCDVCGFI